MSDTLDVDEVTRLVGRSHRTVRTWMLNGAFPRPVTSCNVHARWSRADVDSWLKKGGKDAAAEPPATKTVEAGDQSVVEFASERQIITREDAERHAKVDLSVWYTDRWECTSWQVGMKLRTFSDKGNVVAETPVKEGLWRVKLYLKRILPQPFLDASKALFERMASHAPKYPRAPRQAQRHRYLIEIDLFDAHFGKLAWEPESGQNYDLKIAERVYQNAIEDLLEICSGFPAARFVLPIGNDFYHVDTMRSTTTAGTYVDADGRYAKIIAAGEAAVILAVDTLLAVAPVDVLWVPGNHDRVASYHLSRTLAAWYRNARDVTVDCSPKTRKYLRWGTNLIGYTHGCNEKRRDLPTIMAVERKEDWAQTTSREWRVGHEHRSRKTDTTSIDTHQGVSVRTLQSLAGTDSWHYEMGYVGTRNAAEAYIMGFDQGYVGHFNVQARMG